MNVSEQSLDLGLYREFDQRLYKANQDRNVIAHYNISMINSMDKSLENVIWLQQAMGLVKAEWGVEAFASLVIGINIKDWLFDALTA